MGVKSVTFWLQKKASEPSQTGLLLPGCTVYTSALTRLPFIGTVTFVKSAVLLLFCNSLWMAEILILMYLQDPLIKPRKQWGGELDCQECIFSFFSSCFSHPPGSSVQKLHLFSQAHHTFSTELLFLAFSKTCVKLCLDEQPRLHIGKICIFGKIQIFPLAPTLSMLAFRCPLLPHICSGKELGHCVSKFE